MTFQDSTRNANDEKEFSKKRLLKFTCPECGSNRFEEVMLMRQEIEGVYDPEDPAYDWDRKGDDMVVLKEPKHLYAFPREYNYYRCCQCTAKLTEEDGQSIWERGRLHQWLLVHQESEELSDEEADE